MENEGLIEGEDQARGERGTRRVYHVTAAGEAAVPRLDADPARLSAGAGSRPPARRVPRERDTGCRGEFLHAHITQWEGELEQFEGQIHQIDDGTSPMLNRRLAVTAPENRERTAAYKRFAYEGLVDPRAREIEWARRGLELIDRLES